MIKISRRVGYGLLALRWMKQKGKGLTTAREIAKAYGMPFDPLARTLQVLHRKGVLKAVQGVQGGYRIGTDLSKLSFGVFTRMIVGDIRFIDCIGGSKCNLIGKCVIATPMALLNEKVHNFMDSISIQDLIRDYHQKSDLVHPDTCSDVRE